MLNNFIRQTAAATAQIPQLDTCALRSSIRRKCRLPSSGEEIFPPGEGSNTTKHSNLMSVSTSGRSSVRSLASLVRDNEPLLKQKVNIAEELRRAKEAAAKERHQDDDVFSDIKIIVPSIEIDGEKTDKETEKTEKVDSETTPEEKPTEREHWNRKVDFLLTVVGFAVDLSAVWRFPAVCFSNGGGAFLVPYLIMTIICGLPLMYMEFCMGQFHKNGCITVWKKICPMFKGLGFAICLVTSIIAMYYNTIMAWSVYILFSSFATEVPWESCNNVWNSNDSCVTFEEQTRQTRVLMDAAMNNCTTSSTQNGTVASKPCNVSTTSETASPVHHQVSSAEEYFYYGVLELHKSNGFDNLGPIKWQIALSLLGIFVIVYFALWKGVKSSGKAVWFTATFPYLVMFVLLCRVLTLPGSFEGIKYFLTPNLEALYEIKVWQEAAGQVLFQLGPGFGVLLALSSYNSFNNNCLSDAIITTSVSCLTSIIAGFVVFGTLGYMATMLNKSIDQLETFGHGLTFVAYPEAISTLPGAPVWAILFFAMLINLGLDTTFGGLESMITGLLDYIPTKFATRVRREYLVLFVVVYIYLGALPTCTYGGILLVQFYDSYGVEIPLLLITLLECIGVCYIYGIPQFSKDIAQMHGREPAFYWKFCWCVVSPLVVLFSFVAACLREKDTHYRNIEYPKWANTLGWSLTFFSISCVPIYIVYLFCKTEGTVPKRFEAMIGENAWIYSAFKTRKPVVLESGIDNSDSQAKQRNVSKNGAIHDKNGSKDEIAKENKCGPQVLKQILTEVDCDHTWKSGMTRSATTL